MGTENKHSEINCFRLTDAEKDLFRKAITETKNRKYRYDSDEIADDINESAGPIDLPTILMEKLNDSASILMCSENEIQYLIFKLYSLIEDMICSPWSYLKTESKNLRKSKDTDNLEKTKKEKIMEEIRETKILKEIFHAKMEKVQRLSDKISEVSSRISSRARKKILNHNTDASQIMEEDLEINIKDLRQQLLAKEITEDEFMSEYEAMMTEYEQKLDVPMESKMH